MIVFVLMTEVKEDGNELLVTEFCFGEEPEGVGQRPSDVTGDACQFQGFAGHGEEVLWS